MSPLPFGVFGPDFAGRLRTHSQWTRLQQFENRVYFPVAGTGSVAFSALACRRAR